MKKYKTTNNHEFIVDDEDADIAECFHWVYSPVTSGKYIVCHSARVGKLVKVYSLHRLVVAKTRELTHKLKVTHANGNALDNRRANLVVLTQGLVNARQGKRFFRVRSSVYSRFKGVTRTEAGAWRAQISKKGKMVYLGTFDSDIDAARAYDVAAKEVYGDFAGLNFPKR